VESMQPRDLYRRRRLRDVARKPWPTPYEMPVVSISMPGEFCKNSAYDARFCAAR